MIQKRILGIFLILGFFSFFIPNSYGHGLGFEILPPVPENVVIPDWVRNNAGWWSEGLISDEEFANGLQYLIENGIISV